MIRGRAQQANRSARGATGNPVFQYAARAGYVARGVLYGYMGYAALKIAQTGGSRPADQKASLIAVAGFPLGRFILVVGIAAILAYAGWGFIRGLLSFYVICSVGAVANVGIAAFIYAKDPIWWLAGSAGAVVGAVWNYAASGFFTWKQSR